MKRSQYVNQNSGKDDWCTPPELFEKLNARYHFTLDPCSTDKNALCEKHFTKSDNGLLQNWGGRTFI